MKNMTISAITLASISLFSVFVDDETRAYNREKLQDIVDTELDTFERLINAIK